MKINLDKNSGFCWGVNRTIGTVEQIIEDNPGRQVYVLGEIIHNPKEQERLRQLGMKVLTHEELGGFKDDNAILIIRAHGEPPETYKKAEALDVRLIDATCPLVKNLQESIRNYYEKGYQIVIYGKKDHPEVLGLRGVCNDDCIVVSTVDESIHMVDYNKKTALFSQTTMNGITYDAIRKNIEQRSNDVVQTGQVERIFETKDTICKSVVDREKHLREFAGENDSIIFVAGKNSSNGRSLFNMVKSLNDKSHFVEDITEIDPNWFDGVKSIGVSGATSTPKWYLERTIEAIERMIR
ncbi:MAG: 4-hydroxy-3-methylbut-2-enyl diphosphate reductase [Candidatus Kapaibacterium sp.]